MLGVPSVYSCLCAAAGLSRVLGRRSAPGSGSNCGPGVQQPSSRGRGPDRGTLERRQGARGAEGSPLPAEAKDCATTGGSALLENADAAAELSRLLRKPEQTHRACAVLPLPPACAARLHHRALAAQWRMGGRATNVCGRLNRHEGTNLPNSRLGPLIRLIEHLCQFEKAFTQKCL